MSKKMTYDKLENGIIDFENEFATSLIDNAPIFFVAIDAKGRTMMMNQCLLKELGYTADEVVGKNYLSNFVPESDRDMLAPVFRKLTVEHEHTFNENHILSKDGEELLVEWHGTPVFNTSSELQYFYGFGINITERKQAEKALRESEERHRSLIHRIQAAIVVHDADTHIIACNPKAQELLGLTEDQMLGKTSIDPKWKFLRADAERMSMAEYPVNQVLANKKSLRDLTAGVYRPTQDDLVWVLVNADPVFDDKGEIQRVIITFVDITERKNLETQLQQAHKMESIGTLAGGIAHDFNNILGIILGNTELAIDDTPEWNPTRLNLEEVKTASLRAKDVVRQLLSFARKTELEKKPINITPIVRETLKLLRSSIPKSIEIRQDIPNDIDTILADPTQINQVLINLCTNSAHAMPNGGVIDIKLENVKLDESAASNASDLNSGHYLNLTVTDTGYGIDPKNIDRIFDPYFTTKEVGSGTGMGLAVIHGILKGHGASISVQSRPGISTSFSIFFPVVEAEAVVETKPAEELPKGSERILFIDDEESIVKIGQQILKRLGYEPEIRTNPIEALELFRSDPDLFDLVITDMTMPQMSGDMLAKKILDIHPKMPVILCAGFSEKVNEKSAREMGIAAFTLKPIVMRDIAHTIREVLGKKR